MPPPRMHTQSGLSLAELLVALTVMALVTGLATQGLWTGVRVWERAREGSADAARLTLVRDYLRDLIGQAYPLYVSRGNGGAVFFEGAAAELVFLAPGPRRLPEEGMKRFRLHGAHGREGHVLRLSWCAQWGEAPGAPCRDDEHHVDLLEGVETLRFAYGRNAAASWASQKALPGYLTVEARLSGGAVWRPLTVALTVNSDVTCRFDPVIRDCRRRT